MITAFKLLQIMGRDNKQRSYWILNQFTKLNDITVYIERILGESGRAYQLILAGQL
jgi:hypothetical protein